jgi:hypothetical protein
MNSVPAWLSDSLSRWRFQTVFVVDQRVYRFLSTDASSSSSPLCGVGTTCFLLPFSSITRHLHAHSFYFHVIFHTIYPSFRIFLFLVLMKWHKIFIISLLSTLRNTTLHAHYYKLSIENKTCGCPAIKITNKVKYLGVILDETLSFKQHIGI